MPGNIIVIHTRPGHPEYHLFEKVPVNLYPAESLRLLQKENINTDFLINCFVFLQDGMLIARFALYSNPGLSYDKMKAACIGNYECVNNDFVAAHVLSIAVVQAKKLNMPFLIGPMNGSTWDNYRFSVNDHPTLFFPEPCHPAFYNTHFKNAGFVIIAEYFSAIDRMPAVDDAGIEVLQKKFKKDGVILRNINFDDFENDLEKIYDLSALSFKGNFLYTPISKKSFFDKYAKAKNFLEPRFVILAEDLQKNVIGYFFCTDNFYEEPGRTLIVKTIARHPGNTFAGLGHLMAYEIVKRALAAGYKNMIHAFVIKDGSSVKISESYHSEIYRNYALYGKDIN